MKIVGTDDVCGTGEWAIRFPSIFLSGCSRSRCLLLILDPLLITCIINVYKMCIAHRRTHTLSVWLKNEMEAIAEEKHHRNFVDRLHPQFLSFLYIFIYISVSVGVLCLHNI